ncbi:MAG: hypothetical protein K0M40_02370 [Prolixibacteraceae bacterium]|nr:hypothetical protein [Prolixibacteraceae bacterium]
MAKLRLIFSLFFLLAVQQAYSSLPVSEISLPTEEVDGFALRIEANHSHSCIWGDVPLGRIGLNIPIKLTDCNPGTSKSKVLSGLIFSISESNLKFFIARTSFATRYSAAYIPIYLQTASFLI